MTTRHLNERVSSLCALIAEEKDPGKFTLLVTELLSALENDGRKVECASRTSTARYISPQAPPTQG